jgi:hypothetical protein
MWRLRRVSDDKFLLHGSHRKSSVRAPGVGSPPEAARDGLTVIKGVLMKLHERFFWIFFVCFVLYFGGRRRRRCQREVKRPIISQSSTSHRHHIYKNIVSPVESELGGVEGVLEGAEAFLESRISRILCFPSSNFDFVSRRIFLYSSRVCDL